jgi:glycerol uptake facilitator protein
MTTFLAELIGTMILLLLGDGVVAGVILKKTKVNESGWLIITVGWACAVLLPALIFGEISGAHFNPALTIALAIIGKFPWQDVTMYIVAQMIGAMIGAILVWIHYLPHWAETEDKAIKLSVFCTSPALRNPGANLISEIIGTFLLVFFILALGGVEMADGLGTFAVGLVILVIGVSLGGTTGYAINPARDLGPRIAHAILPIVGKGDSDWSYAWIPVVGPIVGAFIAAIFFAIIF